MQVFVTDAQADVDEALHEYGVRLLPFDSLPQADAIVAAVQHREYAALSLADIGQRLAPGGAFITNLWAERNDMPSPPIR